MQMLHLKDKFIQGKLSVQIKKESKKAEPGFTIKFFWSQIPVFPIILLRV